MIRMFEENKHLLRKKLAYEVSLGGSDSNYIEQPTYIPFVVEHSVNCRSPHSPVPKLQSYLVNSPLSRNTDILSFNPFK